MLQNDFIDQSQTESRPPDARIGDVAAMLRVMQPLDAGLLDPAAGRRRLLADLCRFIGVKVGTLPPEVLGGPAQPITAFPAESSAGPLTPVDCELSPRLEQTLRHLLDGDSEKQVARKMQLSQHTVHVYVKALYRRFGVSSRAELLAKRLRR